MAKIVKSKKTYFFYFLLLILIAIWFLSYSRVPFIFFQQDELMGFGLFILRGINMLYSGFGFKEVVHFVPVTMSISYSIFSFFGLNPLPYNIFGLVFHTLNGFLIFLIGERIFRNKYYSLIATILFFSSSEGNELVMWPVINLNTIALTFSLLLVLVMVSGYLKKGYLKLNELIAVSVLFLLAVFSVEYAAGMILIVPLMTIILNNKDRRIGKLISLWPFWITVFCYLSLRFLPAFLANEKTALTTMVVSTGIFERIINIVKLPFVYISQLFFGQTLLINISQLISSIFFGNTTNTQFAEQVLYRYVSIIIGFGILFFLSKVFFKSETLVRKNILIFGSFVLLSSLPFIMVPGHSFSIFPSRYIYFGTVGYAFLVTTLFMYYGSMVGVKRWLVMAILIFLISQGTYQNYKKGNEHYTVGKERTLILNKIKDSYPTLPRNTIFLIQSNRSYYGLPDEAKILPFQSGFGHSLILWYYSTEHFSTKFFENEFLWDILSEGYREEGNRGFGYFRDYAKLNETINKNKLDFNSVISFKWDYYTSSLTDNTKEIRLKLKNEKYSK